MDKFVFCPDCRQDVEFSMNEKSDSAILKGANYSFPSKTAYCKECGAELYVPEIEDENLKTLYDMYRQEQNLISLEHIRAIPDKYAIGRRPLSLLLGWGEQTFSRYYDGDLPSKQYSEKLEHLLADPSYYLTLLESGKSGLKSEKSYRKSKEATERILNIPSEVKSKLDLVVDYILSQCQDITPLTLQKALYYVQGFHKAFLGNFLFEEDCQAWVHGPVYPEIYRRYHGYCYDPIKRVEMPDLSSMTNEEKLLLDSIIRYICCYSGKTLESFTHIETPWVSSRGNLPVDALTNRVIPKLIIGEYFSLVKEKFSMLTPANIKDYTQDMFSRI